MPKNDKHRDWYRRTVLGTISSAVVFSGLGGAKAPQNQPGRQPRKSPKGGSNVLDELNFGNPGSESNHAFDSGTSERVKRKKGRSARRLLPLDPPEHQLGSMSFSIECDPEYRTYLTLKFESNPENFKRLFLFDGTDIIGYLSPGVGWPSLDMGMQPGSLGATSTHGDFWYATHRLPSYLTESSEELNLRVVSWDGENPSQSIYRAYTHTDPYLRLPANDKSGERFELGPIRDPPAENQIDPVASKIDELVQEGQQKNEISPRGALGLAMAAQRDWIDVADEDAIFETVQATIDEWAVRQAKSAPHEVIDRGWEEHGRFARAVTLLWDVFEEREAFSQTLTGHPDDDITRRDAYVQFFGEGLDWRSKSRREVTNQVMFVTIGLMRMNSVLEKFGSDRARSQEMVDRWIDESIGLTGLTVTDDEVLPVNQFYEDYDPDVEGKVKYMSWNETGSYHTLTEKGLSKEPDHVAHYGELGFSLIAKLYHETGLERVRERAIEASQARAPFRLLVNDEETGNRWAAADGTVSVRNVQHPGMSSHLRGYGFKPLFHALTLKDPVSIRFAKLAMEHNVVGVMDQWWFRVWGVGSLERWIHRVDGYRAVTEMDDSAYQTPMHRDRFAWADEDIGTVSITDGSDRILMNLGYGSSSNNHDWGVNGLARIHHHSPEMDRVLNIDLIRTEFPSTGGTWSRPNKLQFAGEFLGIRIGEEARTRRLPDDGTVEIEQAMAGETLPQAASPDGKPWPLAEDDNIYDSDDYFKQTPDPRVGMGVHYQECLYGQFLIGMNSSGAPERGFAHEKVYELEIPDGASAATDLMTGEQISGESVAVSPRSTRILKLEFEEIPPEQSPIARLDPDTTDVIIGERLAFGVDDTSGNERWVDSLEWTFGDGTTAKGWWNGHRYDEAGKYNVKLTATDNTGAETTDTVTITVGELTEPIARIKPSKTEAPVDERIVFQVKDMSDNERWIDSLEWAFDDGATARGWWNDHHYDEAGEYNVTLTATDNTGAETTDTIVITVR